MCRSDVEDVAAPALTALLLDIAAALADEMASGRWHLPGVAARVRAALAGTAPEETP